MELYLWGPLLDVGCHCLLSFTHVCFHWQLVCLYSRYIVACVVVFTANFMLMIVVCFIPYCFPWCWIVVVSFFLFLGLFSYLLILFFDMVSYLFSLRIGRFFTYLMVCLLSTLCNWGVGSVGAVHPWRMVLPYTINLHSCVDVQSGGNDLDWDALYGLLRSVHARGLLLAPAVATAGQQTRLSAQG